MGVTDEEKLKDNRSWCFESCTKENDIGVPLVLQRYSPPFLTREHSDPLGGPKLYSYTAGDTIDALRMGLDFLVDVFGCTVRSLILDDGHELSELFGLGISCFKELSVCANDEDPVNLKDLKYLLENIKVTDKTGFYAKIPEDFDCNPKTFQCRELYFGWENAADWVTLKVLCQFEVPDITFLSHKFSKKDIVSYATYWFNSENRKLEYLIVDFDYRIALEDFKIDHLNPMPFCEKRRSKCTFGETHFWESQYDISDGMDILREDGLLATFSVKTDYVFFYVWHKRFPDSV